MYGSGGGGYLCVHGVVKVAGVENVKWLIYVELVVVYRGRWEIDAGV